jgi:hypothetical protein
MTLSGASLLTFLITLYTKRVADQWWKWGTDMYAVLWGFIILAIANIATGGDPTDWKMYVLAFFNSFIIAAAAGKLNDKSISEKERRTAKASGGNGNGGPPANS